MSKLLIVDDEEDITQFAKRFFEKRNINVVTSGSGLDALKLVDQEQPDLVLLDIHMQELSGIEVLKNLRESNNDVKVIMVSGIEDPETIEKAKSYNITGFIHKPLVLEELEKIVLAELNKKD